MGPVKEESSPDEDAIALKACENKDNYKNSVSKSAEKEESTKEWIIDLDFHSKLYSSYVCFLKNLFARIT